MEVRAQALEIGYGERIIVDALDVTFKKGEITTIIGPNGSGKSTVLKAMTRLLNYKKGDVIVGDINLKDIANKDLAKHMGVLPQKHKSPPDFTVKDIVSFGRVPYQKWFNGNSKEDADIVEWAMAQTGVSELKDQFITACSGGQSQRVWIATVLAQKPELLFLDEPTTYLDISYQLETMNLVKRLNRDFGIGVVMVLHDLSHALEVSDKIVVIKEGKKYAEGTPSEVVTPKMLKEVYGVEADVIHIEGRKNPIIVYSEIK